jgi:hypothetical protein
LGISSNHFVLLLINFYSPEYVYTVYNSEANSEAASETKIAEVDTSDEEEKVEEEAVELSDTGSAISGPELTFHTVKIKNRGRVPVMSSDPPNRRLFTRTKTGNKAFCTPLQLQSFAVVGADDLDEEGTNPILMIHYIPNGYVHKLHHCWCSVYMS